MDNICVYLLRRAEYSDLVSDDEGQSGECEHNPVLLLLVCTNEKGRQRWINSLKLTAKDGMIKKIRGGKRGLHDDL